MFDMIPTIRRGMAAIAVVGLLALATVLPVAATTGTDPLASWNDGATKQAVISFVEKVTDPASKDFVAPENRIAVFDNDGTLWVEQPMYTQIVFALDRALADVEVDARSRRSAIPTVTCRCCNGRRQAMVPIKIVSFMG